MNELWNRNSLPYGILLGFAIPFVGFAVLKMILEFLESLSDQPGFGFFRPRTIALLAICLNLIVVNFFYKKRMDASLRGVAVATFLLSVVWMIYFGIDLLN